MKKSVFIVLIFTTLFLASNAQSYWSFEINSGMVYNVPMPLTISQEGYPDIKLTARYYTEPLTLPIYYDLRLGRWKNSKLWEFELIHHKLYLENTTPEVTKFNISHGFNMLMVNHGIDKKSVRYRAGAGIVIAHPESNIRGKEFEDSGSDSNWGYYLSGPVINLAISKPIRLGSRLSINAEAKTTLAYSYIKVAEGYADVYNIAFHLILGIEYDFLYRQ
jgi:hypothetical protein